MEKIIIETTRIKFSELTNKSKRKVYKEISKRYTGNNISKNTKFDFCRDIPNMAAFFFESNPYLFIFYKMKCYGSNTNTNS